MPINEPQGLESPQNARNVDDLVEDMKGRAVLDVPCPTQTMIIFPRAIGKKTMNKPIEVYHLALY